MEWDENKDGCLSVSRGSEFTLNYEIDLLVLASSFLECILWIKINYLLHIWPNNRLNPWNKRRYSGVNWGKIASAAIAKWSQSHDMEFFINWRHQWSSRIACEESKLSWMEIQQIWTLILTYLGTCPLCFLHWYRERRVVSWWCFATTLEVAKSA